MTVRRGEKPQLDDILRSVPDDKLDTVDIEGGLTWRQATILGLTSGYLRQVGDDKLSLEAARGRWKVRLVVDAAIKADQGCWSSAKSIIVKGLEVAFDEYGKLAAEDPVWQGDREAVHKLLEVWSRDDTPHITEEFAGNVLWYMYFSDEVS